MPELQLKNISKAFKGPKKEKIQAAFDLNFEVETNEFLVLLGPSGCGKTTTLRLIAGLEMPDTGGIWLNDREITKEAAAKRNTGLVFQNPALLPQLTVRDNILLGLKLRGLPTAQRESRLATIVGPLEIEGLLLKYPETLSGGQQQRVALARALVIEPQVLLMDEPLSNLDPLSRQKVREVIRQVQRELGTTTVYVTHDQAEAFYLGGRIAVMNNARIEQIGTATELLSNPASWFVAQFVGSGVNILEEQSNDLRIAAVRVEHVKVHPHGNIQGTIAEVIDLATHVEVRIKTHNQIFRAFSPERLHLDSKVQFDVPSEHLLFFEKNSGARIRV
jgi:iron(III) transport system ATP-binding protein